MKKYLKGLFVWALTLSLGTVSPIHADECYVEQEPECSNFGCRDALMLGGGIALAALAIRPNRGHDGRTGRTGKAGAGFELPRGEGGLTFRVADFELLLDPKPFPDGVEVVFYVMAPDSTLISKSLGIFTERQDVSGTTISILADAVFGDYEVGLQFTNKSLDQEVEVIARESLPGLDSLFEVEASRDQSVTELLDFFFGYRSSATLSPKEQAQFSHTFTYGLGDIP